MYITSYCEVIIIKFVVFCQRQFSASMRVCNVSGKWRMVTERNTDAERKGKEVLSKEEEGKRNNCMVPP